MTPYRGAPEPPSASRRQLWLLSQGRAAVLFSGALLLFALFMTVSLVRVDSPVALAGLVFALVSGGMFDASFGRLIVDGDHLEHRRGMFGRVTRSLSVANGCTVQVVSAAGEIEGRDGRRRAVTRHLVEVATPEASWVVAEHDSRPTAEGVAAWLRENLPRDRIRVPVDDTVRVRVEPDGASSDAQGPDADTPEGRSQADG